MQNGYTTQNNHRNTQSRISGQKVRSITPCLYRKTEFPIQFQSKKSSFHITKNPLSLLNQPSLGIPKNGLGQNNLTNLNQSEQQYTQQFIMQAQGVTPKKTEPISQPIQTENMFQIYQDIFNNENNRFRSLTPNNRWSKRIGSIKQKNENSYIINQAQNKKQLANQNKDMFILSNYWDQKQQESQQTNQVENHDTNFDPLPTLPFSSSPINFFEGDSSKYNSKQFNFEKINSPLIQTNPIINLQESPEKSLWIPSPKYNKKNKNKLEQSFQNLEDSPIKGGETAHFNNYLQNSILEYIQSQKIQQEQMKKNPAMRKVQQDSIFDKHWINEKKLNPLDQNNEVRKRSATPSLIPQFRINENLNNKNQSKNARRQLKLNKSNINFFADQRILPSTAFSSKRVHTQADSDHNDEDDSVLFIKYNDENIFQQNQNDSNPRRNCRNQSIREVKDTLQQIIQPENEDEQNITQQSSKNLKQFSITSVKNYQKNPSIVQYTPKSTMQKYSKIQRFIPIQNRIIRYPAFINIMHNTTRDQSFQILKKNKLIDQEVIKNCI